jgi:hypothetical protein
MAMSNFIIRYIKTPLFFSLVTLTGCAQPGLEGLNANSVQQTIKTNQNYKVLAKCLVGKFDNEEFGMMDILTPVTMYREYSDEKVIELGHMASVGNVYLWTIKLEYLSQNKTTASYTARNGINPYLSYSYIEDKIKNNLSTCRNSH